MATLSVNINKVATLRNTRPGLNIPSLLHCARICLQSGAHGLTIHPRPDQRHIRYNDVAEIAELLRAFPHAEFNIEGNPFHQMMEHVRRVRPTQATLVPDSPDQATSDHGWNLKRDGERLGPIIAELKSLGSRVSLFMDADSTDWSIAKSIGADRIELYTEPYARNFAAGDPHAAAPYTSAAKAARSVGLEINAGHDLNLRNLPNFIRNVPEVAEVSIGHALIADALEFGLAETVGKYLRAATGQDV